MYKGCINIKLYDTCLIHVVIRIVNTMLIQPYSVKRGRLNHVPYRHRQTDGHHFNTSLIQPYSVKRERINHV